MGALEASVTYQLTIKGSGVAEALGHILIEKQTIVIIESPIIP
jgi:hypothetical protein